jgi:aconitate hydratase
VVGKFVEFYGDGLSHLTLADRATISNMAPEYGATCGFFPIDAETIHYLEFSGREPERIALVEAYAKAQGLWREDDTPDPVFTDTLALDLSTVEPSLAGPKRPQDRVLLSNLAQQFMTSDFPSFSGLDSYAQKRSVPVAGTDYDLTDGAVAIAAITSCTNTSNPSVMIGAGLVARKARAKGLTVKPWVKTSLAPGSQVVSDYLEKANLQEDLDALGFQPGGLRLHHLHWQLWPPARPHCRAPSTPKTWWWVRCCPGTATLRAGSAPTPRPTIWPHRRWWWPTRSRATWPLT